MLLETSLPKSPDQENQFYHVVIVGGGIAGLSAAYYLQRSAQAANLPIHYTLVERDARLGGKLLTETTGEFVVEGGPDSFITQKPWGLRLARELGLQDQLIGTNEWRHKTYVLVRGKPRRMPEGMMLVVPTRIMPFALSPVVSLPGKLRMALDLFIPPRRNDADETLADFIRRRLGKEALDRLAEPMLSGIHNAEAERQSVLATFPRLREIEQQYGSLTRGMIAQRRNADKRAPSAEKTSPFVTFRGGVTTLVDALVKRLDGRLIAGQGVQALHHDPFASQPYRVVLTSGERLEADAVVLAAPAYATADLVAAWQPELAEGLRQVRYVGSGTVSLAFRKRDVGAILEGFGLVIPRTENRRINAVTITSSKFAHRAPDDAVLVRVFVGGSRNPDVPKLDDAALIALVREELRAVLGVQAEPLWHKIFRWPRSNPQYDVGHFERVDALEALCPPGMFLAGSAYRGVGIPDCVRQGEDVAAKVVAEAARHVAAHSDSVTR